MESNRSQISTTTAALLVVVALLASSTLWLAFVAYPKPTGTTATGVPQSQGTLQLPSYKVAGASAQTNTGSSSSNSITVMGTGQVSYTPDEALIQVSVETSNSTAVAATTSNARDMASVLRALNGIGISNSSIGTQGYSLSANYANCYSNCVPQIIGYTVTNSLQVNVTSSNPTELGLKAGQVIDTAVRSGANGISLYFAASKAMLNQLTNEALQGAVASADSQANAIASSLGVSISAVISASESGSYYPVSYSALTASTPAISSASTPITVGTQTVSATVQVIYSIA